VPEWEPRALSSGRHSSYLKVGEGCRHSCSFCIIPQLRGRLRSRPLEELEAEARRLVAAGVREITLIAQDTTAYGQDLYGTFALPRLLDRLESIEELRWIRLLYTDPRSWTEELIDCFGRLRRLVPYVDLPVQHAADRLLRSMRRGLGWKRTETLLRRLRAAHPEMVLRTTVITGYPGETAAEFRTLLGALRDFEFDHLGVFAYSTEEGTPAAELPDQLPEELRVERRDAVLRQQRAITLRRNRARIGRCLEVLVDAVDAERELAFGRWRGQAPEIDGEVVLPMKSVDPGRRPRVGEFVAARVRGAGPYDLIAFPEEGPEP
jgi:ribosomal protein S12 methylthiotransferase